MKLTLNIVGVILVVLGGIWFLQGINVLPGSFMTGKFAGRFTAELRYSPVLFSC